MKKFFSLSLLLIMTAILVSNLWVVPAVSASNLQSNIQGSMDQVTKAAGYGDATTGISDLPTMVGNIIGIGLGLLGMVMVIIIIYSGYLWMTGGGDPEKIKDAKSWMLNAVIGLIILLAAYSISDFVILKVFCATSDNTAAGC